MINKKSIITFISILVLPLAVRAAITIKQPSSRGLVGYWPMEEGRGGKIGDHSGSGNTGTLTNMDPATDWVAGKLGKALDFDGVNDYVDMASRPNVSPTGSFAYSFWVYPRSFANGTANDGSGTYFLDRTVPTDALVSLKAVSGQFAYQSRHNGGTGLGAATGGAIQLNKWTHIVMMRDYGSAFRLYVNGQQVATLADAGSALTPEPPKLASHQSSAKFNGRMDEFRIYNYKLSAAEIAKLYAAGAVKVQSSQNGKNASGLVGLWSFNGPDVAGTTAYDRSGQVNNGTLTNGPVYSIGKIGQGVSLDGVNDYVSVNDSNSLDFGTGDFAAALWFKRKAVTSRYEILVSKRNTWLPGDVPRPGFNVYLDPTNNLTIFFSDADSLGSSYITCQVCAATDTLWHHAAFVFDRSDNLTVYKDGSACGSCAISAKAGSVSNDEKLYIGVRREDVSLDRYFTGQIDEARLYSRALSAAEVKALYNQGK